MFCFLAKSFDARRNFVDMTKRKNRHSGARYSVGIDEVGLAARKRASLARQQYIVGIDEVGRGALAGPVTVAAVAVPTGSGFRLPKSNIQLRDSKKLTPKQRGKWFDYLKGHPKIQYALARVYPRTIDRINITRAANLAALRAFAKLTTNCSLLPANFRVLLDGGLYLGNKKQPKNVRTVIKGDEKMNSIKLASILAKVSRDRLMRKLAKKYPKYGFEIHKGYGTKAHRLAIKKHGPSRMHRLTFIGFLKNSKLKS